MASPLPPDPYVALGVAKDAAAAAIKSQYRKLVLKFHPDKVQDESQKRIAADEFHKIQTAYEIVGDEERRARYDAQCKLAQLRREVMGRQGGRGADSTDMRSSAFKSATTPEMPRAASFQSRENVIPTYEERKPAYASTDYFDVPRTSSRKTADVERTSKKTGPRDDRERDRKSTRTTPKENKKSERADREERNRRATKDIRREREHKASVIVDPDPSSESDAYEHNIRRSRAEEDVRRSRDTPREIPREQARRSREETSHINYESDEKPRKFHGQFDDAKDYITRSRRRPDYERQENERRPSLTRYTSSKDHIAYAVGNDGRPVVRRDSARPQTSEMRRSSTRDYEVKAGVDEYRRPFTTEILDDPREAMLRRPPTLNQSRSSPAEIKVPVDKPRSQSVQIERDTHEVPHSFVRRSETMPHVLSRSRESYRTKERSTPQRSSTLRQAETTEDDDVAGPAVVPQSSNRRRYDYDNSDDAEGRRPEVYRTEVREPANSARSPRLTRSPSPMSRHRETDRERARPERRTTTARYPSVSPKRPVTIGRTTSTTYTYPRPGYSRESSRNDRLLFGEVGSTVPTATISPTAATAAKTTSAKYSPPMDGVRYAREIRTEDVRPQAGHGYTRRPSEARVYSNRGGNNQTAVHVR